VTGNTQTLIHLEPVAAYDCIAPEYPQICERRLAYLKSIERLILHQIPPASRSMLDVGSGDGRRAQRIAAAAGIKTLVLLEPSTAMRQHWPSGVRGLPIRAEDLDTVEETFDVITCLWNVLGHVSSETQRVHVLRQFARLLSPNGIVFIDVNHRYNMREYGFLKTLGRMALDYLISNERNGDVIARWTVGEMIFATSGHVFTHREFIRLTRQAGLQIKKRISVDYRSGDVRRSAFGGNLLYCLT
jgi:2-polyprenyl-3-methyl-5-hydroxy-6-metoxy-1,4-benzoquinol methylase